MCAGHCQAASFKDGGVERQLARSRTLIDLCACVVFFFVSFLLSPCSKLDGGAAGSSTPSEPSASDDTAFFHTGAERGKADRSSVPLRGEGRREWRLREDRNERGRGYPFFFSAAPR